MSLSYLSYLAIVLSLTSSPLAAEDSPRTLPRAASEEWHLIFFADRPAGFIHRTVHGRQGGGYKVRDVQKLSLRRAKVRVDLETIVSVDEDDAGHVTGFRLVERQSGVPLEAVATRRGSGFLLTETTAGAPPRSRSLALPADTVGYVHALDTMRKRLENVGDAVELRILRAEDRCAVSQKAVLGPLEVVVLHDGARKLLRRVEISQPGWSPGTARRGSDFRSSFTARCTQWVDREFKLYKSSTSVLGQSLVTYRATLQEVLDHDFSSPPEVFVSSFVATRGYVPSTCEKARYRLTLKRGSFDELPERLFKTSGQLVSGQVDGSLDLVVRRGGSAGAVRLPVPGTDELRAYLTSNSYLQTDERRLAERAWRIIGKERDAWRAAHILARWVRKNIEEKDLYTVFASAKEVLEARAGDCSEHAVLLAALSRVVGIPSRVVAGLLFREGSFAGHMWVEVYVGEWIPLDATSKDAIVYANRIALITGHIIDTL